MRRSTRSRRESLSDVSRFRETEMSFLIKSPLDPVTFYFSDSNLFYDKFLWTLVCKSPEGWVPLETVASFKRMRDYLQSYGLPFIAQAVRDIHPVSGQEGNEIEVDAEGKQVRRTKSLEKDTSAWDRTVYVKGFGAGETEHNSQEQVEAWFKQFGPVAAVRFRREGEGKERGRGPFKVRRLGLLRGSVLTRFVTFRVPFLPNSDCWQMPRSLWTWSQNQSSRAHRLPLCLSKPASSVKFFPCLTMRL